MKVRFRQQRVVVEHLSGRPAPDDVMIGHHADTVCDRCGKVEVVRRKDDTDIILVNLLNTVGDRLGPLGVERSC